MKKELKLSDFRRQFNFTINHGMADFQLGRLVKHPADYVLDFNVWLPSKQMYLQRPLVWTEFQKKELILSVLKGIKIPPLTVIAVDHKVYEIIDGKQRLSTLMSWIRNQFTINIDGVEYFFQDLDKEARQVFNLLTIYADFGYSYTERKGQTISDDDKIAWFEMINFAGAPQDLEHLKKLKS
jgi:hypothetical protein